MVNNDIGGIFTYSMCKYRIDVSFIVLLKV